jgi:hypothetical protein
MKIALTDKDAEIEPVPTDAHGHQPGNALALLGTHGLHLVQINRSLKCRGLHCTVLPA